MSVRYLEHPYSHKIVAKLIPDQEVEIYDKDMIGSISLWGIAVSKEFKEKYRTPSCHVYPNEVAKDVFARAFEYFYFPNSLQKCRYKWFEFMGEDPAEIANKIIEIHQRLAPEKAEQTGEKQKLKRPREEEKKSTDLDSPEELPPKKAKTE